MPKGLAKALLLITLGTIFSPLGEIRAESTSPSSATYKVLANQTSGLNLSTVRGLLKRGDESIKSNDLKQARAHFDKARILTKQLLGFYRDVNGAFRGIDARIPKEMDRKGREAQVLLADVNLRLAAIFRKQKQPEVAVPLLVEVVKLMTPTREQGQKAYQSLLELGFVETPYAGMRSNN